MEALFWLGAGIVALSGLAVGAIAYGIGLIWREGVTDEIEA